MGNKVILDLMSKTKIKTSEMQWSWLLEEFRRIGKLEAKLDALDIGISPNIFSLSLLEREGVDSAIIEGTQTNHEEIFFDISDGIRDRFSWEVRNLINLYKTSFHSFKNGLLDYNIEDLTHLHRELFKHSIEGFESHFNPNAIIKSIKPGKIIEDNNKPNWIGSNSKDMDDAFLIPVSPSKKRLYLNDMFEEIKNCKSENMENKIKAVIKFHPFFEAVHPFADGNGRLGRLLLVNLFSYLDITKYNWIFISDIWRIKKSEYIKELKNVQTTNNWASWTYFFVGTLSKTVKSCCAKIESILNLYKTSIKESKMSYSEKLVLKYFFKYPILNKTKTIEGLINKHSIKQATAYRSFNNVVSILQVVEGQNKNYRFERMLEIINTEYQQKDRTY